MATAELRLQDEQYLVFALGGEEYGIEIGLVREIKPVQSITRLPYAPEFVDGVVDLRGQIIPILNLRRRFGMPAAQAAGEVRIVVVESGKLVVGLLVDSVTGVLRFPGETIQPPPSLVTGGIALVRGIANVGGHLVALLNPALLLEQPEAGIVIDCRC